MSFLQDVCNCDTLTESRKTQVDARNLHMIQQCIFDHVEKHRTRVGLHASYTNDANSIFWTKDNKLILYQRIYCRQCWEG